jgi:hypothetical protein
MADKGNKNGQQQPAKQVPIEYVFPEGISKFANSATVQNDGHDMYLSFFEMPPPHLIGTEEQRQDQIKRITKVEALCVARIAMSTDRIPGLILALQEQLARAIASRQKMIEEEGVQQHG